MRGTSFQRKRLRSRYISEICFNPIAVTRNVISSLTKFLSFSKSVVFLCIREHLQHSFKKRSSHRSLGSRTSKVGHARACARSGEKSENGSKSEHDNCSTATFRAIGQIPENYIEHEIILVPSGKLVVGSLYRYIVQTRSLCTRNSWCAILFSCKRENFLSRASPKRVTSRRPFLDLESKESTTGDSTDLSSLPIFSIRIHVHWCIVASPLSHSTY